jgi:hypothetical protein
MRRHHFNVHRLMLALFLFCPFVAVWAINTTSLYHVIVPVASQLEDQRGVAESDGFLQVLIRLTSDAQIYKNPVIKSNLNRAEYYVRDYSYSPPSPDSAEYLMKIQYEPEDIARLLTKAGVPFWQRSRPLTLAWVTMAKENGNAEVINKDSLDVYEVIKAQSKKLGLALIFPVMDMDEINQIDAQTIHDVALPELKKASKRYAPDVLLIGQINQSADRVTGKWYLVMNASRWEWDVSGKTLEEMTASALSQMGQTMVRQYDMGTNNKNEFWLKLIVTHVNGNGELGNLMQFLSRLAPVEKLQLAQVAGDAVEVYVLIGGTIDSFQKNAAEGQRLLLKASDQTAKKLTYQWVR